MAREALRVDGGRGDDHFQIRPARQQLLQITEQEINVQAAFVGLVDDDRVVGLEQGIGLGFRQQDAIGHQLDRCPARERVREAHLEADMLAQRRTQLLRDALGRRRRGDTARLGVADQRVLAAPQFQTDFRQLGGLARAGLARHDDHLVTAQGFGDFRAPPGDRQVFREGDRRQRIAEHLAWWRALAPTLRPARRARVGACVLRPDRRTRLSAAPLRPAFRARLRTGFLRPARRARLCACPLRPARRAHFCACLLGPVRRARLGARLIGAGRARQARLVSLPRCRRG